MSNPVTATIPHTAVRRLTLSALVMAVFIAVMYLTQSFAFGQYQIRLATALYSLSALFPFLVLPLGISNLVSNMLMGGLGLPDMVGGFVVGLTTSSLAYGVRRLGLPDWCLAMPVIFCPGLLVPLWLSPLIQVPYGWLAVSITIGQIVPGILGIVLVRQLRGKIDWQQ